MEKTPKRILAIDDDPFMQAAFEIVFKNAGFGYTRAQSAAEGLCELSSGVYSLVIIDSLLPDKPGAALCERLRSLPRYKDLKIIYYSAFFKKAEGLKNLEAGVAADLALQKPVNPEAVLQHAVRLLGGRRGVEARLYGAQFNEIRNTFNGAFPKRLQRIESLIDNLAAGGPQEARLKKLLSAAHKLHGAAALFGHPLAGEAAAIWEEELDAILEAATPVTPLIIGKFRFYFDWLKVNFQPPAELEAQELEIQELVETIQAAPEVAKVAEDAAEEEAREPEPEEDAAPDEAQAVDEAQEAEGEVAPEQETEPVMEEEAAPDEEAVAFEIEEPGDGGLIEDEVAAQEAAETAPVIEAAAEAQEASAGLEEFEESEPVEEPALDAEVVADEADESEAAAAVEDDAAEVAAVDEEAATEVVTVAETVAEVEAVTEEDSELVDESGIEEETVPQEETEIEAEAEDAPEENISEEDDEEAPATQEVPAPQEETAPEEGPVAREEKKAEEEEESSAFVDEVLMTLASEERKKRESEQPFGVLDDEDIVESIEALKTAAAPETQKTVDNTAAATVKPSADFGGPDILIVDDDPVVQRLVSYALGLRGFSHETIGDGDSARVRLFEKRRPPLPRIILLDVDLPGTDGFTLLREIKESAETRDIKVIMVSAHGREEDLLRGFESGATDFIIKPFSVPILAHKIRIAMSSFCDLRGGG